MPVGIPRTSEVSYARFYTDRTQARLTGALRSQASVRRGSVRRLEQAQTGDHQPIGLTGQRRGQNRMTLGIARQLLRERDEVPAVGRRRAPVQLCHGKL